MSASVVRLYPTEPVAPAAPGRLPNSAYRDRSYLTQDEIEKLMAAARKRGRYGARDALAILIAANHGLRAGELVTVKWSQLDLDRARFHVVRLKGSEDGVHPLSGREVRGLRALRRDQPAGAKFVFVSERGGPMTVDGFRRMMQRAGEAAGLGELKPHPHALRHSAGYRRANEGRETLDIAAWLGHRSLNNTKRYAALAADRFDDWFRD